MGIFIRFFGHHKLYPMCVEEMYASQHYIGHRLLRPAKAVLDGDVEYKVKLGDSGEPYTLAQFHCHHGSRNGQGSEHTVAGKS